MIRRFNFMIDFHQSPIRVNQETFSLFDAFIFFRHLPSGREMSEEYESVKKRKSFLIDPNGTLVKIYHKVKPADHAQEVLDDLLKIQTEN